MPLTGHKLPLGKQITGFVDWLTLYGASLLDRISDTPGFLIHGIINGLLWFNLLVLIILLIGLAHSIQRSQRLTVSALALSLLILNLGYRQETMETLAQVIFVTLVYIVVGAPLSIVAMHKSWLYIMLRLLLDLMQIVPTFIYLIPTLTLSGLGVVPGLVSTMIFVVAVPIHLTCLGIQDVPAELLDAGKAFGYPRWQLLTRIKLPYTAPSVAASITQCIMLSLSMVVIAVLVGADGLGKPVINALSTADISLGFGAGLAIVLLAVLLDRVYKQRAMEGK